MPIRTRVNTFEGWNFYESSFDTETGLLVRDVVMPEGYRDLIDEHPQKGSGDSYPGPYPGRL